MFLAGLQYFTCCFTLSSECVHQTEWFVRKWMSISLFSSDFSIPSPEQLSFDCHFCLYSRQLLKYDGSVSELMTDWIVKGHYRGKLESFCKLLSQHLCWQTLLSNCIMPAEYFYWSRLCVCACVCVCVCVCVWVCVCTISFVLEAEQLMSLPFPPLSLSRSPALSLSLSPSLSLSRSLSLSLMFTPTVILFFFLDLPLFCSALLSFKAEMHHVFYSGMSDNKIQTIKS